MFYATASGPIEPDHLDSGPSYANSCRILEGKPTESAAMCSLPHGSDIQYANPIRLRERQTFVAARAIKGHAKVSWSILPMVSCLNLYIVCQGSPAYRSIAASSVRLQNATISAIQLAQAAGHQVQLAGELHLVGGYVGTRGKCKAPTTRPRPPRRKVSASHTLFSLLHDSANFVTLLTATFLLGYHSL